MSQPRDKFIMTMDKPTVQQLLAAGFKLISHIGGQHVFLNQPPKKFNFEQFDKTKVCYTNMLSI